MPFILVHHKVADYATWKPFFDQHAATRKASGCQGGQLFRTAHDANELVMILQWDNMEKARQFAQSSDLREVMQKAGVIGQPEVYFLETIEEVAF
jgi:quinol monooxygenase YgiN